MPWKQRYGEVANLVKAYLGGPTSTMAGKEFTSAELVEALMPIDRCRGEQITARNELFTILGKLAKYDLADYCHKSDKPSKAFGKTIYPWVWHANRKPKAVCPHCGGVL
jgi:hypothetical protein